MSNVSLLPPYVSARVTGQLTGALFVLAAATSWIAVGYDFAEVRLFRSIQAGHSLETAERLGHAQAGDILGGAQILAGALLASAFLPWLFRTRVNVRAFGARRMRFARHWTLLGFFVPLLNVVRPYHVVCEIWKASDPRVGDPLEWRHQPVSPLVLLWWGTFVGYLGLELLSGLILDLATGLPRIELGHALSLIGDLCAAVSASTGYFVVARLTDAQEAKHAAWGRVEPTAAPLDPRDAIA